MSESLKHMLFVNVTLRYPHFLQKKLRMALKSDKEYFCYFLNVFLKFKTIFSEDTFKSSFSQVSVSK